MKKLEVHSGDRFGMSTIIKEIPPINNVKGVMRRRFLCQCDCGNIYETDLSNLTIKRGKKSCGCFNYKGVKNPKQIEIKNGDRFGKLVVLKEVEPFIGVKGNKMRRYLCKCDCGNEKIARFDYLRSSKNPSCGCIKNLNIKLSKRKYNTYETDGEVTKVFDNKGNFTLTDTEDLEKVKPYYFYRDFGDYFVTNVRKEGKKTGIFLHRLITDCPEGMVVDHINHSRNDNRKCNLKICTLQDNRKNMPFIGIVYLEHINKWQVSIKQGNEIKYLGVFEDFDEAVVAFKGA